MPIDQFITRIKEMGIRLWLDQGQLRYQAPKNVLTNDLRAELTARKHAIIASLVHASQSTAQAFHPVFRDANTPIPLSFAQQRLWFLAQLEADSSLYNIPSALRLLGPLDSQALAQAFTLLEARHDILRTSFTLANGQPVQKLHPPRFSLDLVDISPLSASDQEAAVAQHARQHARFRFDLATGPLWRAALLRLNPSAHVLLLTLHHTIADGWSMGILMAELSALYSHLCNHTPLTLPPLPIQYADYALWQRAWLQGPVLKGHLAYWQEQLSGAPPLLTLPTDKPRPAVQSGRGAHVPFSLSPALTQALKRLSRQHSATLFMTLEAAFAVLLSRYAGQQDILIGTPIADRPLAETEPLIGLFQNTLVLRNNVASNPTFSALLAQVQKTALDAYEHQALPFEMLVEALQPERSLAYSPVFQVMFNLLNYRAEALSLPGLSVQPADVDSVVAVHDLALMMQESETQLSAVFKYSTDLFTRATIEHMAGHFQVLLEAIVADPQQPVANLPLLTAAERQQMLVVWNATDTDYPDDRCIHQLFEAQVERNPEAVALLYEQQQMSYRELNTRANRLAHGLRTLGVGPEVLVGIWVDHPVEFVIGVFGVLKAGGAYLPLEPTYPTERLAFMLSDARVSVLLADQESAAALDSVRGSEAFLPNRPQLITFAQIFEQNPQEETGNPVNLTTPDNLAYVIYTSGSTGRPKGTLLEHRGLVNATQDFTAQVAIAPGSRVCQLASWGFDASVMEVMMTLTAGTTLVMVPREIRKDPQALVALLRSEAVSAGIFPPSLLDILAPADLPALTTVLSVGEACSWELAQRWSPGRQFINSYGPTEATIASTFYRVDAPVAGTTTVPVGRPFANVQFYLLDRQGQPVPVGVPGELHIGGVGLARGYLNRPDLTAERFIPNPFAAAREVSRGKEERLYRTGDLMRYLPDGNLEYLGRFDHQVKLRGFRIELGEIESVLRQHPAVHAAVVIAWGDGPGEKRLVAYVVLNSGADLPSLVSTLRAFLGDRLPEFMIPAAFVNLEALPLSPNGKVDRTALPTPTGQLLRATQYDAPRTALERELCVVWQAVLQLEKVGVHDNFFELGGHSLLAAQVVSHIRQSVGLEVSLRDLFAAPTIAELSAHLKGPEPTLPPITPVSRDGNTRIPLSFAQQRLWFLAQLEADSSLYNIPSALRLHGPLDSDALSSAFKLLEARHDILRTSFPLDDGQPYQQLHPPRFALELIDLSQLAASDQEAEVLQHTRQHARFRFDLATGPLWRAALLRLEPSAHVLLLTLHHTIADGWSMGILMHELSALYSHLCNHTPLTLLPLPIQYADYALWQRAFLQGPVRNEHLAYWQKQLALAPPLLTLPTDKPRPPVQSGKGAHVPFALSASLTQSLKALARKHNATLFMTLEAAFAVLLSRYAGQQDILIGTPIANRQLAETEPLIGLFLNALVLRNDISGNPTFSALLAQVQKTALDAFQYQALPFEMLVEALQPERSLAHSPVFQVMFNLVNNRADALSFPGVSAQNIDSEYLVAKHDLVLVMWEQETQLCAAFEYNTDLFTRATVERMAGHFQSLLSGIVANPDCPITLLPMLTPSERHQLVVEWNDKPAPRPDTCFHRLFEERVQKQPGTIAVLSTPIGGKSVEALTYAELNQRANQLARQLRALGVGDEAIVGVYLERSAETLVSMLAIFKAGGAYIPLDPSLPNERVSYMIESSGTKVVLTRSRYGGRLTPCSAQVVCIDAEEGRLSGYAADDLDDHSTPRSLAYVLFTSGSTGRPKAVMVEHRGMINNLCAKIEDHGLSAESLMAQTAPPSFDISMWQFLVALLVGGRVRIFEDDIARDPSRLMAHVDSEGISILELVPSLFRFMLGELAAAGTSRPTFASLRWLSLTGEALPPNLCNAWFSHYPHIPILNAYGPAECSDDSTHHIIREALPPNATTVSIGQRIPNVRLYVLDAQRQLVPVGVPGELYIGGVGVGRGYLHDPEQTARVFSRDPFVPEPDARMYQTGDSVRYREDGTLEFFGRLDTQVKIRGIRVELGEIEALLKQHETIQDAVAAIRTGQTGEEQLIAYVTLNSAPLANNPLSELQAHALEPRWRDFMAKHLPSYMIPDQIMRLDAIPLNANGKVDHKRLPAPAPARQADFRGDDNPRTETEEALAAIWREVLSLKRVGRQENFFEIGGHSLLATVVISRIRRTFEIELPLRCIFNAPTVAALAEHLEPLLASRAVQQAITGDAVGREEITL